ncbi:MAG: DNA-directed RNA polymerase subunit beta [Candidatus Wallbacteria bacterium]|nr:DNA-directed RNA polymerase subunit beta [Candidatus Wallbacteria bacterium]
MAYRIKYEPTECQKRDLTYSIPLNMRVRLINKLSGEVKEQELFVVNLPLMTRKGTFVINGAERVIVSQLHRSPGVYFDYSARGAAKLYSTKVVPYRGAWLEFELDVMKDIIYVRLDRKRKIPVTVFLRALGFEKDDEILELFDQHEVIKKTLKQDKSTNATEALDQIYKKLRPGEPFIEENARALLEGLFFNRNRYDLGEVGRYKLNQKLRMSERIIGQISVETLVDPDTSEVYAEAGERISANAGLAIDKSRFQQVRIRTVDEIEVTVKREPTTFVVDLTTYDEEKRAALEGYTLAEDVIDPELNEVLFVRGTTLNESHIYRLGERKVGRIRLNKGRVLELSDILGVIRYLINLSNGIGQVDDIDHLGNRRVRRCGELLQNQFRVSLARMERVIRERMTIQDINSLTPQVLINTRPIVGVIDEFFGSSQLSQFMDQVNPLSELTHKRRLSALGPGGLRRERAGYEVRDVHPTHFGRVCPIETPEGPNAGLIGSLAVCSRLDEHGFLTSPYLPVENGKVRENPQYMDALEEERFVVSPYDSRFMNGVLQNSDEMVPVKMLQQGHQEFTYVSAKAVNKVHMSPLQMISVASSLIPFLEHDDANRALMGTNMQRQAVPLLVTEAPIVGTGLEWYTARDSGAITVADHAGTVVYVDSQKVIIRRDEPHIKVLRPATYTASVGYELLDDVVNSKTGKVIAKKGTIVTAALKDKLLQGAECDINVKRDAFDEYRLITFARTNQGTCNSQKPIVRMDDHVEAGAPLADGASTNGGELALGRNILMAFMPFQGYNFEDAIVISEKLVKDEVFSSIHINVFEIEARDTKLGPEEITRDIPNVGEDVLANLDEAGIIRIGAEVQPGDVLVGKITPKGETELTAEDKLLRAIFGEKAREVRNTSLTVPHGEKGKVVDVMVFSREGGDELPYGVNKLVRVFVAQKRPVSEGDKMAGRHGNKGVIAKIVPEEDMPYLPDGRTIEIVLNPLGVPSRMNVGQVLETHLGWAGMTMNRSYATCVFNGGNTVSNEQFVINELTSAGLPADGRIMLRDGSSGDLFDQKVMVGNIYMMKLAHLVDDKIHARATGPYSLVTQQPLGGKAQFGGQRFGEMEVWALEAYGAAHTLRELLTIKSDDVEGRVTVYETIIKGENEMKPSVPESFKVVVSELQSLGLKVDLISGEV